MADWPAHRPPSIRSVASNSSLASGVSLSRRPRTRTRSKTVTGASGEPESVPRSPGLSDLPYLAANFTLEPEHTSATLSSLDMPPPRPAKSPQRFDDQQLLRSSDTASSSQQHGDETFVVPVDIQVRVGWRNDAYELITDRSQSRPSLRHWTLVIAPRRLPFRAIRR